MESNKQIENMENVYGILADMKLPQHKRAILANLLCSAFMNGFRTALAHTGITDETEQYQATQENETAQHIVFLSVYNGK